LHEEKNIYLKDNFEKRNYVYENPLCIIIIIHLCLEY